VRIDRLSEDVPSNGSVAYPDLLDWRERIGSLSGFAAHSGFEGTYVAEGVAEIWRGRAVTGNLLTVLGVAPVVGAGFADANGAPGSSTIVIAHDIWEQRFGRDPGVIGRTITFDNEMWEIVGVLPRGFTFPTVRRYADVEVEPVRRMLWIFQGSVLLVLLVACANVAGLTLARTERRRVELAIRASIGASRGRLIRQILAESITLAPAGGVVGVAGAFIGVNLLLAAAPADLPRCEAVHMDPAVLLLATLLHSRPVFSSVCCRRCAVRAVARRTVCVLRARAFTAAVARVRFWPAHRSRLLSCCFRCGSAAALVLRTDVGRSRCPHRRHTGRGAGSRRAALSGS